MTMTLTVLRCPDGVVPETRRVNGPEFTLGRASDASWTLQAVNKDVSRLHLRFIRHGDEWEIVDCSTNGTFLNGRSTPLKDDGGRCELRDGDRLRVGAYEFEVQILDDADDVLSRVPLERGRTFGEPDEPAMMIDQFAPPQRAPGPHGGPQGIPRSGPTDDVMRLQPIASEAIPADFDIFGARAISVEPLAERKTPPRASNDAPAASAPQDAPAARVRRSDEPATLDGASRHARSMPTEPAQDDMLAAFLRGAGMPDARPPDPIAMMERLGATFRAFVSGLRTAMIGRAGIKREFRIGQTMLQRDGNNPLKFSANDDEALAAFLGIARRSEMPPERAVIEALRDIHLHELACIAAMRQATADLVADLDPARVRAAVEQGGGLSLVAAQRKARAWDAYEAHYARTAQALTDDFDRVFGNAFARAYEEVINDMAAKEYSAKDSGPGEGRAREGNASDGKARQTQARESGDSARNYYTESNHKETKR